MAGRYDWIEVLPKYGGGAILGLSLATVGGVDARLAAVIGVAGGVFNIAPTPRSPRRLRADAVRDLGFLAAVYCGGAVGILLVAMVVSGGWIGLVVAIVVGIVGYNGLWMAFNRLMKLGPARPPADRRRRSGPG